MKRGREIERDMWRDIEREQIYCTYDPRLSLTMFVGVRGVDTIL